VARHAGSKLYYTIGEVAQLTGVKPHVLRYWESEFKLLKPRKTNAGRRAYTPREVRLVFAIRKLLYEERYTLEGAKKKMLDLRRSGDTQLGLPFDELLAKDVLGSIRQELKDVLGLLEVMRAPGRPDSREEVSFFACLARSIMLYIERLGGALL